MGGAAYRGAPGRWRALGASAETGEGLVNAAMFNETPRNAIAHDITPRWPRSSPHGHHRAGNDPLTEVSSARPDRNTHFAALPRMRRRPAHNRKDIHVTERLSPAQEAQRRRTGRRQAEPTPPAVAETPAKPEKLPPWVPVDPVVPSWRDEDGFGGVVLPHWPVRG